MLPTPTMGFLVLTLRPPLLDSTRSATLIPDRPGGIECWPRRLTVFILRDDSLHE
jgi:hypothetical protein